MRRATARRKPPHVWPSDQVGFVLLTGSNSISPIRSPFCALARLPALSMSPILRTIAWLGYVLVATSFVTSAIFRLRMKFLATPERAALFAQVRDIFLVLSCEKLMR